MDLLEAIYARRSVREYTAEAIDEKTLKQLIDAAVQAPSAVNQQPWSFTVVRDKAVLAAISDGAKAHMLRTSAAAASHHFHAILSDPQFDIFHDAPALIVIAYSVETNWAVEDCALAAENLMLAARALGLGTCWIGFAQGWLATAEGKRTIRLPDSHRPVARIIVGRPKAFPAPVSRREPEISWIGR